MAFGEGFQTRAATLRPRAGLRALGVLQWRRCGAIVLLTLLLLLSCAGRVAHAVGTPAGTTISNSATLNYSIAGTPFTHSTNVASFRVDELISVRVTPPAAPANVGTPDTNRVLAFTVSNVGNAPESYTLTSNLNPGAPVVDQFNPLPGAAGQLFRDVNGNGQFDVAVDTAITGPLLLNADQTVAVLLVSNIPSGLANGNQGVVTLNAASTTPGAIVGGAGVRPGTVLPGAGTAAVGAAGIDALVGAGSGGAADSGADASANGVYVVGTVAVSIAKTVIAVTAPSGVTTTGCDAATPPAACATILPGAVVQYQLTLTIAGAGTAQGVLVTDNIPVNTTYVANSIRLNGVPGTDQADADRISCPGCGAAAGTVTVNVGDVPVVSGTPVIFIVDYKVSIN